MARSRNIKPGFFSNELLAEADFATRLLFIGLWTEADREGRLEDRPRRLKMALFPADAVDVDSMLASLHSYGFISRYERNGVRIIQIVNWAKHQNPHHTEKKSVLEPEITGANQEVNGELTVKEPSMDGEYLADSLIPDSLIPEEKNVAAVATTPGPDQAQGENVFQIDRIPYEKIRELYNSILGGKLKRCMGLNETHRKHIRGCHNLQLEGRFVVRDGGLAFWEGLFNDVLACPFMLGVNGRSWRADFEFLTTATKVQRFMEGKYDAA